MEGFRSHQTEEEPQADSRKPSASGDSPDAELASLADAAHQLRFNESSYLLKEKHMTRGSQVWVLNLREEVLLFAKETGSYSREFFFHIDEDDATSKTFPLMHITPISEGTIRSWAMQGTDFSVKDWQDKELFTISRALTSLNRTWKIFGPDGQQWGRAFEGLGTSVARRLPLVTSLTVLSMKVELVDSTEVATFKRKRRSLRDVYELNITLNTVDRRLLIALGVLFETIHD